MENPRRLLCIRVRQNDVEISSNNHILSSVINAIYYTIIDYIEMYRKDENVTMSYLEKEYYLDDEFINCENPELYLYENRELREFFKIWDEKFKISDCICTYDGKIYSKINGVKKELPLKECKMPFKTKQRSSA